MSTPEIIVERALALPERAKAIVIKDSISYSAAGEILLAVKAMRKEVESVFGPMKQKAHAAWKAICEEQTKADTPLVEAESIVKKAMAAWDTEQERIRLEEQRRLEAEARRQEEERRRIEAAAIEAERARVEAERKEQEAAKMREAEALAAQGKADEAEAAMQAAIEADRIAREEQARLAAEAAAVREEPIMAPVIRIPTAVPKVSGVSFREVWKAEVVDFKALVKAAAENDMFLQLLEPNTTCINSLASRLKSGFKVPGIRVSSEKTVAAGRR